MHGKAWKQHEWELLGRLLTEALKRTSLKKHTSQLYRDEVGEHPKQEEEWRETPSGRNKTNTFKEGQWGWRVGTNEKLHLWVGFGDGWVGSKWGGDHPTIAFMVQYQNISKNSIGQTFLGKRANTWKLIFDLSPSSALTLLEAGQTLYLSLGHCTVYL